MSNKTENNGLAMQKSSRWRAIAAILAIVFGVATIWSGGSVVFDIGEARPDAGTYVTFVVWFNFVAGFFYVLAGIGIFFQRRWAVRLAAVVAVATLLVFVGLGVHILNGGSFEIRTIAAMIVRSVFWVTIALLANRLWSNE